MKKTVKIVALALVLVMVLGVLASCGGVSGEYESEKGHMYEFSGNRFTYTMDNVVIKGTYSIKEVDGDKRIVLNPKKNFVNGEETDYSVDLGGKNGLKFYEGEGYIVIATTTYTKR